MEVENYCPYLPDDIGATPSRVPRYASMAVTTPSVKDEIKFEQSSNTLADTVMAVLTSEVKSPTKDAPGAASRTPYPHRVGVTSDAPGAASRTPYVNRVG